MRHHECGTCGVLISQNKAFTNNRLVQEDYVKFAYKESIAVFGNEKFLYSGTKIHEEHNYIDYGFKTMLSIGYEINLSCITSFRE